MPHNPSSPPWVIPWNSEGLSNESVRRSVELASMAFHERVQAPDSRTGGPAVLRRRRAIVGLSLLGFASTALVSLSHLRVLRNQAEPSLHAAGARSSSTGTPRLPDAMLSMATHAVNIILAGLGSEARTRRTPWVPITAAGKAAADVGVVAARYGIFSSGADRPWSGYAVVDAVARLGTLALAIPEAVEALRAMLVAQPAERRSG